MGRDVEKIIPDPRYEGLTHVRTAGDMDIPHISLGRNVLSRNDPGSTV